MTSVIAWAPAARAAAAASSFSVVITSTAAASASSDASPFFSDVVTAPAPTGLVRTSASPERPRAFVITSAGSTTPVTAMPYLGSGSSIVCPPTIATPASCATSAPPRSTSPSNSDPSSATDHATRFSALTGRPPIAYTSESAFVAAIRPKS